MAPQMGDLYGRILIIALGLCKVIDPSEKWI